MLYWIVVSRGKFGHRCAEAFNTEDEAWQDACDMSMLLDDGIDTRYDHTIEVDDLRETARVLDWRSEIEAELIGGRKAQRELESDYRGSR